MPKGLFQYTRLPYGVSTAPAIFQSVMDRILQGLPVACYLDDILVAGRNKQEHDQRLEQVLQHLPQSGIHLQKEKCLFCQTQVEYLGHCVDTTGIHPTEKKVTAIKEAPVPTDASHHSINELLREIYTTHFHRIGTIVQVVGERAKMDLE